MSCTHCGTKFNFFHKEVGCANCGLSFCNKCLNHKYKKPGKLANEANLCRSCLAKGESTSDQPADDAVHYPDSYYKRLEALERVSANNGCASKNDEQTSNRDQQLAFRLEKLKGAKTPPTEDELRRRLATLKDQNDYVEGPSKTAAFSLAPPDTRTDQEKVDSLLHMFSKEREIDLAHDPEADIVARLVSLRDQGARANEGAYLKNLHDSSGSEEDVDMITRKIMDEVALEERTSKLRGKSEDPPEESEFSVSDLPWCVLCNNDACFRCVDCNDLYCKACNREVHKSWDGADHKVVPYRPAK